MKMKNKQFLKKSNLTAFGTAYLFVLLRSIFEYIHIHCTFETSIQYIPATLRLLLKLYSNRWLSLLSHFPVRYLSLHSSMAFVYFIQDCSSITNQKKTCCNMSLWLSFVINFFSLYWERWTLASLSFNHLLLKEILKTQSVFAAEELHPFLKCFRWNLCTKYEKQRGDCQSSFYCFALLAVIVRYLKLIHSFFDFFS